LENAEVWRIDWHDFLTAPHPALEPIERFERLVAADVVYYASDLPALAASVAAHLLPGGRGYILVPEREWTGPLVSERSSAEDLVGALKPFGEVRVTSFIGHCGTLEGQPVKLVELRV
ncbi:unnamed protein product, partial [Polarella glacialis]